ncbi:FAD-dependent oxidoreductase [Thermoleophilia bacterium SCSIO 60948]|nr:FAD-dependent oxidoreductase [Thermoleophilia bacterium SCSIO 60948]
MSATYDVCIIGGGAAGLFTAIRAAEAGASTALVSRKPLAESSSYWAQGGLAAALAPEDSVEAHVADTLRAGRELCDEHVVRVVCSEAPAMVRELTERGVEFDPDPEGRIALGLEGGHSERRIVHCGGSQTGRAITSRLAEIAASTRGLDVLEGVSALALWSDGERCHGAFTDRGPIRAGATVAATGGGAALWRRTTNPFGAIGAGAVMAHSAGAELRDLELCQFHPTALSLPGTDLDGALVTEAVRGEGARLLGADGARFTDELAPRDEVSAAVLARMALDGRDFVGLDLTMLAPERFPNVFATCRAAGLDPRREPVPVAPAAHYLIGGITTDVDGRTTLPGLLAVGEATSTGLHGANRLASNSLSECFVFGARAAGSATADAATATEPAVAVPTLADSQRFHPPTLETRSRVWDLAGPQRSADRLERLLDDPYPLARAIAASALARSETRGAHRRDDHPEPSPALARTHFTFTPDGWVKAQTLN